MQTNAHPNGLDAEIAAARAGMIAHIDEHVIPLMVRRALARMAAGDGPSIPPPKREWPKAPEAHPALRGCSLSILRFLEAAGRNTTTGSMILDAFVAKGVKYDTVAKAKTRLSNLGLVVKEGPYWNVAENPVPVSSVTEALNASGQTSVGGLLLAILKAGPAVGMTGTELDAAMVAAGVPKAVATRNRYAIEQRGRIVRDRAAGLWRLP